MVRRIRSGLLLALLLFSVTALGACTSYRSDRSQDDRLAREVMAELEEDRRIDVRRITVQAKDGLVQLSGFVDSKEDKERAEEIAEDVRGVEDVENDLIVD
jgi:hyperosmotically inducible protein